MSILAAIASEILGGGGGGKAQKVEITNDNINEWYDDENAERDGLYAESLLWTVAFGVQLALYYDLWDEAVSNRDTVIDKHKLVLDYLHDKDMNIDYPQMQLKQEVINLPIPAPTLCADSMFNTDYLQGTADALNDEIAGCGLPTGWVAHDGDLHAGRALSHAGALLANSGKRREESFRRAKTNLVLSAQRASRMSINPILASYTQAIGIHEGLASTYLKGFNSAGAGLGINIDRLSQGTGQGGAI